ncbi:MAG TPA: CHAT domain-containing protein, partial [Kribbellaceae bacterium]|nr:CHAT domain-containing protein [Kribbellaceae bacterium]
MTAVRVAVEVSADGTVRARLFGRHAYSARDTVGPLSGPDWDLTGLFRRWLSQRARVWQPDEVRAFGVLLHRRLFAGPNVWPWIEKQTDGAALVRLTLSFPAEPPYSQLAALPWEYLYVPGEPTRKGEFLAEREGFSLARYIPLRAGVPQLSPVERPRLLAVVSSPETLGEVVAEPVLAALRDAAGLAGFEHREVRLTSADEMRDAIAGWQPHLVHFLGHGEFDQATGAGLLAFPAAGGRAAWVGDAAVAKLFVSREHAPRVVVLHACEGGVTDYDAQFAGVASTLTRAGAQCVVAMQYPVTNRAAIAFSTAFYRELAAHGTVDLAAQQARRELAGPELGDPRLVGIPVIYLHNDTSL